MATDLLEPDVTIDLDLPKGFEMVEGQLVEMPAMGSEASWVASRVFSRLDRYCEERGSGVVVTAEFSYQCFPNLPRQVRKPDVSVILCDPKTYQPPRVHSEVPPDLIVESISPGNDWTDIMGKLDEFLDAGTRLAWIIDVERRIAYVQRLSDRDTLRKVRESGTLDGEDVLPGFTLPLAAILPPKL